jgi:hypothetical protein
MLICNIVVPFKVVPYTSGKIWSARLIFLFFDYMIFVCRFQASRWSKSQREKLLCGYWIYTSESVDWNLLKFWYLLQWIYSNTKQMYLLVIYTELHPIQRASCSFNSPPRNKRSPFPMDCNLLPMRKVGPMSIIWHSLGIPPSLLIGIC